MLNTYFLILSYLNSSLGVQGAKPPGANFFSQVARMKCNGIRVFLGLAAGYSARHPGYALRLP